MAPSTPPPPRRLVLAAFTMASTGSFVISPKMIVNIGSPSYYRLFSILPFSVSIPHFNRKEHSQLRSTANAAKFSFKYFRFQKVESFHCLKATIRLPKVLPVSDTIGIRKSQFYPLVSGLMGIAFFRFRLLVSFAIGKYFEILHPCFRYNGKFFKNANFRSDVV